MASEICQAALAYGRQGFAVLPLRERGKEPLTRRGVHQASTDPEQISRWWTRRPSANVGLAVPPDYLVLDLDSHEALPRLKAEGLSIPSTSCAATGRGLHFWFSTSGAWARNRIALLPEVDVRASGGYVVAPPSVHANGQRYQWKVRFGRSSIAEAPQWLLERLGEAKSDAGRKRNWLEAISNPVPEGQRNVALAQVAGLLFRKLPAALAAELAYCWAQARLTPPLPDREVQRTLDSIAGRELRRRKGGA